MSDAKAKLITIPELEAYLDSLEKELDEQIIKKIYDYKLSCNINLLKVRQREIIKIQKTTKKEYEELFDIRDEIIELLEETEEIPTQIERLKVLEYMLYRVDLEKAEKIVNKATKKLEKMYSELKKDIEDRVLKFPSFAEIDGIDFSMFGEKEDVLAKSKEQYKLEYTEEQKKALIEKEMGIIDQAKSFNLMPIPHEILKSLDRDVQPKIQKFNAIRQKRIRILETMRNDYEKLIEPREILCLIEDANEKAEECQDILTKAEYTSIKKVLIRRKKRVIRSTKETMSILKSKENKTGITNFNLQQARYLRMDNLRKTISDETKRIKENQVDGIDEQLEKLKISYEREKQFASVIEKLNDGTGMDGNYAEVRVYEEQINSLQTKLTTSTRIIEEAQEKIKNAKKELLVLWKMEINSAVSKKKEEVRFLTSGSKNENKKVQEEAERVSKSYNPLKKLKKISRRKTRLYLRISIPLYT